MKASYCSGSNLLALFTKSSTAITKFLGNPLSLANAVNFLKLGLASNPFAVPPTFNNFNAPSTKSSVFSLIFNAILFAKLLRKGTPLGKYGKCLLVPGIAVPPTRVEVLP